MQGIFRKENTDKALKYGIYRHLPTYEKIIRNLVSFYSKNYRKEYLYIISTQLIRDWMKMRLSAPMENTGILKCFSNSVKVIYI